MKFVSAPETCLGTSVKSPRTFVIVSEERDVVSIIRTEHSVNFKAFSPRSELGNNVAEE